MFFTYLHAIYQVSFTNIKIPQKKLLSLNTLVYFVAISVMKKKNFVTRTKICRTFFLCQNYINQVSFPPICVILCKSNICKLSQASPTNIKPYQETCLGTSTLVYFIAVAVIKKKSFVKLTPNLFNM